MKDPVGPRRGVPWSGAGAGGAGQEGDEVLGVGAAQAGNGVPAGSGGVADVDPGGPQDRVVAGDHVVEGAVVGRGPVPAPCASRPPRCG